MITMKEAAAALDGNQYLYEGSKELFAQMKAAGLVAVFGLGGDLMVLEGAVNDKIDVYDDSKTIYFDAHGLIKNECDDDDCPYFQEKCAAGKTVTAFLSSNSDEPWWTIKTYLPHETFKIIEDDEIFCIGLVFSLADCMPS